MFAATKPEDLPYHFQCSSKLDKVTCERQISLLREIVGRQHAPLPIGWTWLIVDDSDWPKLQQRYGLKYDFAFIHRGERRTVLNSLLFRRFERPVWEWAVAHETAHVICDLSDESKADRVARELTFRGFSSIDKTCPNLSRGRLHGAWAANRPDLK